ncbi:MAG: hypothetical protein IRZ33_06375 [Alicyclobacillaceae bacterium]|nr:hypothetical protein [Alicyclobacillaceae bacterium]
MNAAGMKRVFEDLRCGEVSVVGAVGDADGPCATSAVHAQPPEWSWNYSDTARYVIVSVLPRW